MTSLKTPNYMKIQTKFNIGNMIYYLDGWKIEEFRINRIDIKVTNDSITKIEYIGYNWSKFINETEAFATKKEAKQILKNKIDKL